MLKARTRRLHVFALILGSMSIVAFIIDGRVIGALLAALFIAHGATELLSGKC